MQFTILPVAALLALAAGAVLPREAEISHGFSTTCKNVHLATRLGATLLVGECKDGASTTVAYLDLGSCLGNHHGQLDYERELVPQHLEIDLPCKSK